MMGTGSGTLRGRRKKEGGGEAMGDEQVAKNKKGYGIHTSACLSNRASGNRVAPYTREPPIATYS